MVFPTLSFEAAFGVLPGEIPDQHLDLGATSDFASAPDAAGLRITGDLDLRINLKPALWFDNANRLGLLGRADPNIISLSYALKLETTGAPALFLSSGGGSGTYFGRTASAVVPFLDGESGWVRATWRASDGRVQFFTSTDGASWTQLGSNETLNIGSIHAGTADLWVGGNLGGGFGLNGKVYAAEVRSGIGGPLVAEPDFTSTGDGWTPGDDSGTAAINDAQANPWSLQGAAEIVNEWADLTDRLRVNPGIDWEYGRQNELDRVEAGVGTVYLGNLDRALDPTNTASVYYPFVRPMVRVRLRATHNAVTYDVLEGFVESWPQSWPGMVDAVVPISVVDGFKLLSMARTSAAYSEEASGTRLGNLLDAANWPTSKRDLDAGLSDVQAYSASDRIVLNAIKEAVEAESGVFFIAPDGNATFRDRYSRISTTAAVTFGDDTGELGYRGLVPRSDDDQIWNDIAVKPEGLTVQRAQDNVSQAQYGIRSLPEFGALITTESEAADASNWTLRRYKDARFRVDQLTVAGHDTSDLLTQALARGVGDRLTVRRRPPGGGAVQEVDVFIEQVTHKVEAKRWTTTWQLSPAFSESVWLAGLTGFSEAGETTFAGY